MINLIPPEGQKIMKREYLFRVGGVLSFLFGGVLLLLTVAFIPTYILVGAQIDASLLEADRGKGEDETFKKADAEVKTTKELIRQLRSPVPEVLASVAIEEIEKQAPAGVLFKSFTVEEVAGKIVRIRTQGTARTREDLARLKNTIEASPLFAKAEVPIADLAREADLPFTITITLTESTNNNHAS